MRPILAKMLECFRTANAQVAKLDEAVARHYTRIGSNNANSSTLQRNFSTCGGCGGMTTLKELRRGTGNQNGRRGNNNNSNTKILHCETCNLGLRLPRGSPMALTNTNSNQIVNCPICNYQVVKIGQGDGYTGNGYHLCPKCFSDAPEQYGGGTTSGEFRCFNCTHPTCSLASGTSGEEVFPCPFCEAKGTTGKISLRKNSRGYILSCSNYATSGQRARCEFTIWLPREARSVSIASADVNANGNGIVDNAAPAAYTCNRCSTGNKLIKKLKFVWKPGSVPPGTGREHIGCVLCDQVLKSDFHLSVPRLNQVQFRGRQASAGGRGSSRSRGGGRGASVSRSRSRERNFQREGELSASTGRGNAPSTNGGGSVCYRCNQPGHYASNCPTINM